MNRNEILTKADEYVNRDRNVCYGDPEDAFATIAELWCTYLANRNTTERGTLDVDAYDVACMMSLMKVARMAARPKNPDSCIDLAGYAACAGEILDRDNQRRKVTPTAFPQFAPAPPAPAPVAPGE